MHNTKKLLYVCHNTTNQTKRIYSEISNHEEARIRQLYLGKITDTEAELETNFTSKFTFIR